MTAEARLEKIEDRLRAVERFQSLVIGIGVTLSALLAIIGYKIVFVAG